MAIFYAIDNEFAASTGSNVNSGTGTSIFDYPPSASSNLMISSNPGDPPHHQFEVGDTYEISFGGMGGGTYLEDAEVIRSYVHPAGGNAVVFEGLDDNGDLVQVVWTPGLNLEQWYWDHFSAGQSPGFHTNDRDASTQYGATCFSAQTLIATEDGPVPAGDIAPGTRIWTLDSGFVPLMQRSRFAVAGTGINMPVTIRAGAFGAHGPVELLPQHGILMRGYANELLFAAEEVLVAAADLVGMPGVAQRACARADYVHLILARHEIVNANGLLCESLFLGAGAQAQPSAQRQSQPGRQGETDPAEGWITHAQTARRVLQAHEAAVALSEGVRPAIKPRRRHRRAAARVGQAADQLAAGGPTRRLQPRRAANAASMETTPSDSPKGAFTI